MYNEIRMVPGMKMALYNSNWEILHLGVQLASTNLLAVKNVMPRMNGVCETKSYV